MAVHVSISIDLWFMKLIKSMLRNKNVKQNRES